MSKSITSAKKYEKQNKKQNKINNCIYFKY